MLYVVTEIKGKLDITIRTKHTTENEAKKVTISWIQNLKIPTLA